MYRYTVTSNKFIAKDITLLQIKAKSNNDIFDFLPGQYAAISFKKNGQVSPFRCFSIASSPSIRGRLEFGIKIEGKFTQSVSKLNTGDDVYLMDPYGEFTINPQKNKNIVFIAGGVGITPFISMLRTFLPTVPNTTMLYSIKSIEEAAYLKELLQLSHDNSNFKLMIFVTKEKLTSSMTPEFFSGRINSKIIESIIARGPNPVFYLCGPSGFMAAIKNNLIAHNISDSKIISEEFTSISSENSEESSIQSKINRYVLATIIIGVAIIGIADINKALSKFNNTVLNQTQGTAVTNIANNSTNSSTDLNSTANSNQTNQNVQDNTSGSQYDSGTGQSTGYSLPTTRVS